MSKYQVLRFLALSVPVALPAVVAQAQTSSKGMEDVYLNTLSPAQKKAGWILLFDGKTLKGWRGYKNGDISAWTVENGTLTKSKTTEDLVTTTTYGDFELAFDWKIGEGGNAGVFVRGTEEYDKIYWSATEYQLLDDAGHSDGKNPLTSAGSAYGLYPSIKGTVKPANQWNTSKIVVKGNHVEHWLNGVKMVEYEAKSADWTTRVKASKFKDYPNYGMAMKGLIGIQGDHNGTLSLRNIMIHPL